MQENIQKLLISSEYFEELTGVNLDEIKYGITIEDKKNLEENSLEKLRNKSDFETALRKASLKKNKDIPIIKKENNILYSILFNIVFFTFLIQLPLWIIDFVFKSSLSTYRLPIVNIPVYYYITIPLGIWMGIIIGKDSNAYLKKKSVRQAKRLESLVKLRELFIECENYNRVIRSIESKDKISNVLEQRNDPIRADIFTVLHKIHDKLVKALKIEKLLRENLEAINIGASCLEITLAEIQYTETTKRTSPYSVCIDEILTLGTNLNRQFKTLDNFRNS